MPSEARTCGELRIRVVLSLSMACSNAFGRLVVQSRKSIFPILERLIEVPVDPLDPFDPLDPPLAISDRGVNARGIFRPPEAMVAARSRVRELFASITITSTTTSDFGRSKS